MEKMLFVVLIVCFAFGCASTPLKITSLQNKVPDKDYQVLGAGEGSAVGFMLFGCIPIGQNERFESAYGEAVKSKGGNMLIDPVVEENWFWTPFGDGYVTKISGTVVKSK